MKAARDILVIDDEEVVVQGVARICRDEGMTADGAASGREGLDRLRHHAYRLVLCDIMMEELDGFEFMAEARRQGHREPVVMTTGYSTVENAVRALTLGAIDCLAKPFTPDELLAVVRRGMNVGRLETESERRGATTCPPRFHRLGCVSWAEVEAEGTVRIGVNDLFVRALGGVRGVDLAPAGTDLAQGRPCAAIASADGLAHGVMCPVSGQVLEANAAAAQDPALIESAPYAEGWLYRIVPSDLNYNLTLLSPQGEPAKP
jgi:CheY-like chemotaxis protein/glycine cleavage system H lipoate-binding protein